MNKKLFLLIISVVLIAVSGCSAGGLNAPTSGDSRAVDAGALVLDRDALPSYKSDFSIQFSGAKSWSYSLLTRKSPELRESSLHIEGVESTQNLGDVRLVTDGTTSWMAGEGTDNECVQFPNGAGMDPKFLHPETLVSRGQMEDVLKKVGEETVGGVAMVHYLASGVTVGAWKEATLDLWTEKDSGMLLQFKLDASGDDPFFGTGAGKVTARYTAAGMGEEAIAPVEGCAISVPLPGSAQMFVRLPGMASFDSTEAADVISGFYQTALPQEGWAMKENPAQTDGITVLSYLRGAESVEVHIEEAVGGSRVKLLFMPVQ